MAIAAILLGVFAFIAMFAGVILTIIPYAGAIFSALAVIASVAGIVLGGLGRSRAAQDGEPTTSATVGLVINIVAVIFALLVFMTCGLCNACFSSAGSGSLRAVTLDGGGVYFTNRPGDSPTGSPFAPQPSGAPEEPANPSEPTEPTEPTEPVAPADPSAPPPAFPPPEPEAAPTP